MPEERDLIIPRWSDEAQCMGGRTGSSQWSGVDWVRRSRPSRIRSSPGSPEVGQRTVGKPYFIVRKEMIGMREVVLQLSLGVGKATWKTMWKSDSMNSLCSIDSVLVCMAVEGKARGSIYAGRWTRGCALALKSESGTPVLKLGFKVWRRGWWSSAANNSYKLLIAWRISEGNRNRWGTEVVNRNSRGNQY